MQWCQVQPFPEKSNAENTRYAREAESDCTTTGVNPAPVREEKSLGWLHRFLGKLPKLGVSNVTTLEPLSNWLFKGLSYSCAAGLTANKSTKTMPEETVKSPIGDKDGCHRGSKMNPKQLQIDNFFKISCAGLAHPHKSSDLISNY